MQELKERIVKEGKVLPGNIIKVDGFLNHRIDTGLLTRIAEEFGKYFNMDEVTMILTAEASGIALSAIVARLCGAGLLVLFSDIDGLYDADPTRDPAAKLIPVVPSIDAHILALGGGSGSGLGTGGMATKLKAAQIVTEVGCQMVIANGSKPPLLYDMVGGKPVGTRFLAKEK